MSEARATSSARRLLLVLVGVVCGPLAMVALVVTLARSCGEAKDAIEPYVADLRAGRPVHPLAPTADLDAAHRVLARSTSLSIANFQMQSDSACVWAEVQTPDGDVDVAFLLVQHGHALAVASVTTRGSCTCPDDVAEPCRLE